MQIKIDEAYLDDSNVLDFVNIAEDAIDGNLVISFDLCNLLLGLPEDKRLELLNKAFDEMKELKPELFES